MKSEHIVIIVLLVIILAILIYVAVMDSIKGVGETKNVSVFCKKTNAFLQDLCTQINEDRYYVLICDKSFVDGNILYITKKEEKEMYRDIIELLAIELHKKTDVETETIREKLEQVAYNLGYLTCTVNCKK